MRDDTSEPVPEGASVPTEALAVENFVDGDFKPSASGRRLDLVNPATGEIIGSIPRSDAADAERAVDCAAHAAQEWRKSTAAQRASALRFFADRIAANAKTFAWHETQDTGKPLWLSSALDIPRAEANFRFFADLLSADQTEASVQESAVNYTLRDPLGTVALITPWNLPLYLLSWKIAPALAMGNTVVAKPSELTPQTATLLCHAARDAELQGLLPVGTIQVVHGYGAEAGEPLCTSSRIAALSFTGGTQTGARVAALAAPTFKKLSLELGGKNATIVFSDRIMGSEDLRRETVGQVLRAAFLNAGQICLCGSRILIEKCAMPTFLREAENQIKDWTAGDPLDSQTRMGPVVSAPHRDKLLGAREAARKEGADLLEAPIAASAPARGFFVPATLITGLPHTSALVQSELFGPIVTVHPFEDENAALELAHQSRYGLAASIWTSDIQRALRLSAALDVGMVWVNTWLYRDLRAPFGGNRESGVGREGGLRSFDFYSNAKNICLATEVSRSHLTQGRVP